MQKRDIVGLDMNGTHQVLVTELPGSISHEMSQLVGQLMHTRSIFIRSPNLDTELMTGSNSDKANENTEN